MQEKKVTYQELARQAQKKEKHQIVLAIADGKIRELFQTAKEGEEISFLTTADRIGHLGAQRSHAFDESGIRCGRQPAEGKAESRIFHWKRAVLLSTGWTEGGQYVHRSGAGADERAGGAKSSVCKNDENDGRCDRLV